MWHLVIFIFGWLWMIGMTYVSLMYLGWTYMIYVAWIYSYLIRCLYHWQSSLGHFLIWFCMHLLVYVLMYVLIDIFFSSLVLRFWILMWKGCTTGMLHSVILLTTTTTALVRIFWSTGSRAYVQTLKGNSMHIIDSVDCDLL